MRRVVAGPAYVWKRPSLEIVSKTTVSVLTNYTIKLYLVRTDLMPLATIHRLWSFRTQASAVTRPVIAETLGINVEMLHKNTC